MKSYLMILFSVAVATEIQFLRTDADIPLQRRLADQEVPIKSSSFCAVLTVVCGTYESECISVGDYSYQLLTKHNGKENLVAETFTTESKVYSGSECSGSVVMEEDVTYKWVDYSVVTQYPCGG